MELKKFIDEITEELENVIYDALQREMNYAYATINTNDGYIEICSTKKDKQGNKNVLTVEVYHDNESEVENTNLIEFIERNCKVDWMDVQQEIEDNYKASIGLDPAFSSWADFWQYKQG